MINSCFSTLNHCEGEGDSNSGTYIVDPVTGMNFGDFFEILDALGPAKASVEISEETMKVIVFLKPVNVNRRRKKSVAKKKSCRRHF